MRYAITNLATTRAGGRGRGQARVVGRGGSGDSRYLTFAAGARIEVVEERESGGWWAGKLNGKLGWFPSSFCTIEGDSSIGDYW